MRNIFKNIYFYIFLIIFFLGFNYFFGGSAFSSSWFGIWNTKENVKIGEKYIRTSTIDDTSVGSVIANINLGEQGYKDKNFYYLVKFVDITEQAKNKIDANIVNLLDGQTNKSTILEAYLSETQSILSTMSDVENNLREVYNSKKSQSITCQNEKKQADNSFFNGLSQNDKQLMIDGLNLSLEKSPCYIKNRIISNAYNKALSKISFYNNILEKKYNLLFNNRGIIIQNISLFKNSKLERLTSLRNQLNSFNISNSVQ